MSFTGTDLFGRPVVAVRGKSGSIIIVLRDGGDDSDDKDAEDSTISLSAESVAALAKWIKETP